MDNSPSRHTVPPPVLHDHPDIDKPQCFIHNLPNELLLEVFGFLSKNNLSDGGCTGDLDIWDLGCVTLQHVSKRWQDLALRTPTLWSEIKVFITIPMFEEATDEEQKRMQRRQRMSMALDELFKRSRNTSLDMAIDVDQSIDDDALDDPDADFSDEHQNGMPLVLSQIWSTCDRWRSLEVCLEATLSLTWEKLTDFFQSGMPGLESLYFEADDVDLLNLLGRHAPNLRSLTMVSLEGGFSDAQVLPQVTKMDFDFAFPEDDRNDILSQLPNIQTLSVHLSYTELPPELFRLPLSCHTVIFSVSSRLDLPNIQNLMTTIQASSATNVTVRTDYKCATGDDAGQLMLGLKAFVLQSSCKITHFVVEDLTLTWTELTIPLEVMRGTLTHFKFRVSSDTKRREACSHSGSSCFSAISMPVLESVEMYLPLTFSSCTVVATDILSWWVCQPKRKTLRFEAILVDIVCSMSQRLPERVFKVFGALNAEAELIVRAAP